MDQLRNFFRVVKRIHFWLICGLITVFSLAVWFMAVGELSKERDSRAAQIKGLFDEVTRISSEANIPNSTIAEKMDGLISLRQEEILEAWQVKYDQQNSDETGILTWPKELGRSFMRKVTPLRPIEKEVAFPVPKNEEILNIGELESYRDYIRQELPKLAESVGAEWSASRASRGIRGGGTQYGASSGSGESLSDQSIVDWDSSNQSELVSEHFTWGDSSGGRGTERMPSARGSGSIDPPPSTLEVLYAQEDLWVLRSLMKIIAETNAGATSRFNAAVKRIDFIRIGKNAVKSAGRISAAVSSEDPSGAGREGSPYGQEQGYESQSGYGSGREAYGEGGEGGEGGTMATGPDPADLRYVDKNYEPLPATELRTVMTSTETLEPEKAYLVVAKRVPIRMRVSIDQRKLPNLLVQCANAELTVEVRQLRVNPDDDGTASTSRFGAPSSRSGRSARGSGRPSGMPGRGGAAAPVIDPFPFDVTVELYGIVYLYNPVDRRALGMEVPLEEGGEIDPNNVTERADPTTLGFALKS